jgi:hypothetical protein
VGKKTLFEFLLIFFIKKLLEIYIDIKDKINGNNERNFTRVSIFNFITVAINKKGPYNINRDKCSKLE